MKITFIGLSCFLIENTQGDKLLIDPYNDSPEYYLGLKLPPNLEADLFLVSHPDEDHSYLKSKWLRKRQDSKLKDVNEGISLFPDINIKGTLVKEWNGDLNIAWSFTIDSMRCIHLADNAHELTEDQLKNMGKIDVLFCSPPKIDSSYFTKNIKLINPKIVIPSHYIPPKTLTDEMPHKNAVSDYLKYKLLQDWVKNPHSSEQTVGTFTDMFVYATQLNESFKEFKNIYSSTIEIKNTDLDGDTKVMLFRDCLGN